MSAVDDFWNEVALAQMASGQAPSVVTKDMRKALDGDKDAVEKIKSEIDTDKAIREGQIHRAKEICKAVHG